METRAHHVLIGLFTVIVVGAALLFGLWLAKTSAAKAYHDYEVVFSDAVTGLSTGSPVGYNGIKVGEVVQLKLDPADPRKVLARIRLTGDTPVKQDTHAKLVLTGLTGITNIQLSGGSPDSPPLLGQHGHLPVIVADPSPLTRLLANGEDLMTNINEVVMRANELLSDENVQHIDNTLAHLDQATGTIANQRDEIRQLLQQLALASNHANATLAQTEQLARNANSLISHQGKAALDDMQASMASLQHATASLDHLLSDNRDALDSGMRGIGDIGPAVIELRKTLDSLRSISRKLDDNPASYLLGREKTKEFKP
ncbi:MAG: MCE family protein [Rhodanobacter sp.]|jgi:phospholipid/cholesterol/gamma-HCH transport system substrate-binding protein|nr:MCE family protein [Rhodanobacter sp.]